MEFNDLTDAQKARARECKTPEEMLALAREEGYELSGAELEAVSGGSDWDCSTERVCFMVEYSKSTSGGASGSW